MKVVDEVRDVNRLSLKMTARPPPRKGRWNDLMAYPLGARPAHLASSRWSLNQVSVRNNRSVSLSKIKLDISVHFSGGSDKLSVEQGYSKSSRLCFLQTGEKHGSSYKS